MGVWKNSVHLPNNLTVTTKSVWEIKEAVRNLASKGKDCHVTVAICITKLEPLTEWLYLCRNSFLWRRAISASTPKEISFYFGSYNCDVWEDLVSFTHTIQKGLITTMVRYTLFLITWGNLAQRESGRGRVRSKDRRSAL